MIVYYEKQVPNIYDGELEDEEDILKMASVAIGK